MHQSQCATRYGCRSFLTILYNGRTAVVVRDPRNVLMSERKMRISLYQQSWIGHMSLNDYVLWRFEVRGCERMWLTTRFTHRIFLPLRWQLCGASNACWPEAQASIYHCRRWILLLKLTGLWWYAAEFPGRVCKEFKQYAYTHRPILGVAGERDVISPAGV